MSEPTTQGDPKIEDEADPQANTERPFILDALNRARLAYAEAKLGYHLSRENVPGVKGHPKEHVENVLRMRRQLEAFQKVVDAGFPMADPPPLEVSGKTIEPATVSDLRTATKDQPPDAPIAG